MTNWETIAQTEDFIIDYDKTNTKYRVSYFQDNHFVDDIIFDSYETKRTPTEEEKEKFKSLFKDKEKYYALSTIYDLAFEDDVNGTCDGVVDAWLVATLTSKDVKPVVHGHWVEYSGDPNIITCSECDWGTSPEEKGFKFCPNCSARMDGGKN